MLHLICITLYTASPVASIIISRDSGPVDSGDAIVTDPGTKPFLTRSRIPTLSAIAKLKSFKKFHAA